MVESERGVDRPEVRPEAGQPAVEGLEGLPEGETGQTPGIENPDFTEEDGEIMDRIHERRRKELDATERPA